MSEPQPQPARDQVDDWKDLGFTVAHAFDIAGIRWWGPGEATWEDLEELICEVADEEVRPR